MSNTQAKVNTKFRLIIVILSLLLVCSLGALAARALFLHFKAESATVVVPNNYLGNVATPTQVAASNAETTDDTESVPDRGVAGAVTEGNAVNGTALSSSNQEVTASLLEFYKGRPDANKKFEVRNMVPGDLETRYFCVRAHHSNPVTLIFSAEITEQTNALGDVLDVTVTNTVTNEVICQGTFNEINGMEYDTLLPANADGQTTNYYRVDVSMDTSVGNPYQASRLLADFHWYIEEGSSELDPPPQTGDPIEIASVIIAACLALFILFLLLFVRRRKEEEEYE